MIDGTNNIAGAHCRENAPQYRETVIHVNDASRAVTVAGSLLNKDKKYTQVILEQNMMRLNVFEPFARQKFLDY
jgi:cobalamin-dependent methionine synthase I